MDASQVCKIETCKKPFRAFCYCCQHKLCIVHLNEHSSLINAQLVPLADEINTVFDLFKTISSSRPSFLLELETWRQDACGKIDNLYQRIRQEFEETLAEERIKQKNELDQLRNRIDKLIEEEEASQKHIDTISDSIQSLRQTIEQSSFPHCKLPVLKISQEYITIEKPTILSKDLWLHSNPWKTMPLKNCDRSIAASDNHLLVVRTHKLCLFDQQLTLQNESPYPYGNLCDMFWSQTIAQFILITGKDIYTLDEQTMTVKKSTFSNRLMEREWWCGTCSNDSLFVTAKVVGSSVFEFSLQPSIELVEEHRPPIFCTQDEFISDISASNNFLAIAVVNDKDDVRFDLYAIGTRQQVWSLQLDRIPSTCRIRCCTLNNDQWIMIDRNKRELYHISQNGKLINKEKYREVPWNAVQFNINCIAILTKQNINLHQLF